TTLVWSSGRILDLDFISYRSCFFTHRDLLLIFSLLQNLVNLKWICLSYSKKLTKIPDLSRALNLEVLNLRACKSLAEIPVSLKYLSKLKDLDLSDCFSLRGLPSCLHLISLKRLDLLRCSITKFPNIPCYARHPGNTIEKVHLSIGCPFQLSILYLDSCLRLKSLPDSICNLIHLRILSIRGCINLCELPQDLGNLECLEAFVAYGSGIKALPDSICNMKNCKLLNVNYCVHLYALPENLGNLKSLKYFTANGSGLKELPGSICNLKRCRSLSVTNCVNLRRLPENLGNLESLKFFSANGSGIKEVPCSFFNLKIVDILSYYIP
ncbi:disease resistance protein TAO1, partial [Euphorbia lathyris]|uniref:disease resistance protein TAO1 n=1 Tax=Euphorbia lathyris TaxID=212925 RepID=UPI0033132402